MKKSFLILLLLALPASSLLAQDTIRGIAADIPILMHRSLSTTGAFPLPWKRSVVIYEYNDRTALWSFGWGKDIETELGWNRYHYSYIYSYALRWKVPFGTPLKNGVFAEAYYSSYENDNHLDINLGYVYNINKKLSIIPRLKLQGSSSIAPGISATIVPLKFLSGNLGTEYVFDNVSGVIWKSDLNLKVRIWKGLFFEEMIAGEYESYVYYHEYINRTFRDWKFHLRQYQYLGVMF